MKLRAQPRVSLCDERLDICVTELPSFSKVKLSASMCYPWAKDIIYKSAAWFTADSSGDLDVSNQRPDSGSYDFADSMGLILSLKRVEGKFQDVIQNVAVDQSLSIEITAECEQDTASVTVERLLVSPDVRSLKIDDEFVGELFYAENSSRKTIVVLGGSSNEELCTILPLASLLASHGFNALALAYFGENGLNSALAEVPLEYFEKVFAWLEKNPFTNCREIYIYGGFIGAELALLLASRYPIVTKVIAVNPIAWCFQGLTLKRVSLWTYGGRSLPFIKFAWALLSQISSVVS